MSTPTELWNRKLMSVERDISTDAQPQRRYAILSVPRSGSTLLARGMEATGLLGVPLEYFNQNALDAWRYLNAHQYEGFEQYLSAIEKRQTTSNGWFGLKVHYRHFDHHYAESAFEEAVKFVGRQNRCIFVTRRDHIAQAVSYFRARATGMWSSEHKEFIDRRPEPQISFQLEQLMNCLLEIRYGEQQWRNVLSKARKEFLEIVFEDFIGDYLGTMQKVFRYLGITEIRVPAPQLQPINKEPGDTVELQFREFLLKK
jgi:LPS sulfotransferase NodH